MEAEANQTEQAKWCRVDRIQRRVLGVLVEKSKTTPDIYPMTINAITTASNQKSNRKPLMQLEHEDVEDALTDLRDKGAVIELQSEARKPKYRHQLYQWFGIGKVELAIMAELLLRGEQTLGDLRGRAARMEKIADVSELRPIVRQLQERNLIIALTPAGRGQMVTHNLYQPEELAKLERQLGEISPAIEEERSSAGLSESAKHGNSIAAENQWREMRDQIAQLQAVVSQLQSRIELLEQRD